MMDLKQLYTDMILEYNRDTRHRHELASATCSEHGHNPSCGDDITLHLQIDGNQITDLSYTGQGCAISQASAVMMIDLMKGKTIADAESLSELFLHMITREVTDESMLEPLEDAMVLQNISNMPSRVKCAVLAWRTLQAALERQVHT